METQFEIPNNVSDLIAAMNLTADFAAIVNDRGIAAALSQCMDGVLRAADKLAADVTANGFKDEADEDRMTAKMLACTKVYAQLVRARKAAKEFDAISSSTGMVIH
jgi:hypothetical protein